MKSSISELGIVARPGQMIRRPIKGEKPDGENIRAASGQFETQIKVSVIGINIEAYCGVYDHEKGKTRPLIIDIEAHLSREIEIQDDKLSTTLDYDLLVHTARDLAQSQHFALIETFALAICDALLANEKIQSVKVNIQKPNSIKGAIASGTEVVRTRL